jgi:hypothetical protein
VSLEIFLRKTTLTLSENPSKSERFLQNWTIHSGQLHPQMDHLATGRQKITINLPITLLTQNQAKEQSVYFITFTHPNQASATHIISFAPRRRGAEHF